MNLIYNIVNSKDFYWKLFALFCIALMVLSVTDFAFATDTNDVIGITLCRVVGNLSGGIAKSIATIAIFAVGVALFMGKLNWGTAAMTAAGVGIVFGAPKLVNWISGATGTDCTG